MSDGWIQGVRMSGYIWEEGQVMGCQVSGVGLHLGSGAEGTVEGREGWLLDPSLYSYCGPQSTALRPESLEIV